MKFDDILQLYGFDRRLCLVFLDAIDRIEAAFRVAMINTLALDKTCGSHFYLDAIHFENCKAHHDVMKQVRGLPKKTAAIKHYYYNYNTLALPPVWIVLEAMTIGSLSRLFSDLPLDYRKTAVATFRYDESVLVTWLKSLTILEMYAPTMAGFGTRRSPQMHRNMPRLLPLSFHDRGSILHEQSSSRLCSQKSTRPPTGRYGSSS